MTVARQLLDTDAAPSSQSLRALDAVNFFVGSTLAGFGPFVALFLGGPGWALEDIGFVLTLGGVAGLLAQYPGGELLDAVRSKRLVLGSGLIVVGLSALMIGLWPTFGVVVVALVSQGATGGLIGPAIPAVSLGLVGEPALAERLGRNQRFQSAGSLLAAGLMGALGYLVSNRLIFSRPRFSWFRPSSLSAGSAPPTFILDARSGDPTTMSSPLHRERDARCSGKTALS
jgi:MFS family permease